MHSNSSTPPPPPPPPKDHTSSSSDYSMRSTDPRYHHRLNSSFDNRHSRVDVPESSRDILNRSKSYDNRLDDTPHRPINHRTNDVKHSNDRGPKKSTAKLFGEQPSSSLQHKQHEKIFSDLPDIEKYSAFYANYIVDFTNNFYGNILEKQVNCCHGTIYSVIDMLLFNLPL